jgi:hypothetical protein
VQSELPSAGSNVFKARAIGSSMLIISRWSPTALVSILSRGAFDKAIKSGRWLLSFGRLSRLHGVRFFFWFSYEIRRLELGLSRHNGE